MIGMLTGKVIEERPDSLVIQVGGVGYEVTVPEYQMRVLRAKYLNNNPQARLTDPGVEVTLYIHHHVSATNPVPALYGFNDLNEKRFFEKLITVDKLGPTSAAKTLTISVSEYASRIMQRDVKGLSTLKGIAARTAEKIVATLHGKVALFAMLQEEVPDQPVEPVDEILRATQIALEGLGLKPSEAEAYARDARKALPKVQSVEELLQFVWSENKEADGNG